MATAIRSDFNGDGDSDIAWRGPAGQVAIWEMDGAQLTLSSLVEEGGHPINPGLLWQIVQSGDFNADGNADLLWRGPDGEVGIWNLDGPDVLASSPILFNGHSVNPGENWTIQGAGDFNGDGMTDILWRSTASAGALHIWDMDNETILSNHPATQGGGPMNLGSNWQVAGVGDFNNDGMSDILWRSTAGQVGIWQMNDTEIQSSSLVMQGGNPMPAISDAWSTAGVADFTGDGKADILWRGASGGVALWEMDGADLVASSPITQNGHAVNIPNSQWSIAGTGDYNGDGKADILWRASSGQAAIWTLTGTQLQASTLIHDAGNHVVNPGTDWQIARTT